MQAYTNIVMRWASERKRRREGDATISHKLRYKRPKPELTKKMLEKVNGNGNGNDDDIANGRLWEETRGETLNFQLHFKPIFDYQITHLKGGNFNEWNFRFISSFFRFLVFIP